MDLDELVIGNRISSIADFDAETEVRCMCCYVLLTFIAQQSTKLLLHSTADRCREFVWKVFGLYYSSFKLECSCG